MSHFYGSIQGQSGEATRMGSKSSGYRAWAQSWDGCVSISLWHSNGTYGDEPAYDQATISIGPGGARYGSSHSISFNLTDFPAALDCGDKKIDNWWSQIQDLVGKIDMEARAALKRAERRKKIEANREDKARKEQAHKLEQWKTSGKCSQAKLEMQETAAKMVDAGNDSIGDISHEIKTIPYNHGADEEWFDLHQAREMAWDIACKIVEDAEKAVV